jgi:DNA-binding NarL/FixJ family response regulator
VSGLIETEEEMRSSETLRVLLVDDQDLFRTGLRNLLESEGLEIVGEAATGAEAVAHVGELSPDVVVMDLNMPSMGGVEATRHIAEISPLTRVVMLTISDQDSDVTDAILAGACGYLLKDASIDQLVAGIHAAARGESLISPPGKSSSACVRQARIRASRHSSARSCQNARSRC